MKAKFITWTVFSPFALKPNASLGHHASRNRSIHHSQQDRRPRSGTVPHRGPLSRPQTTLRPSRANPSTHSELPKVGVRENHICIMKLTYHHSCSWRATKKDTSSKLLITLQLRLTAMYMLFFSANLQQRGGSSQNNPSTEEMSTRTSIGHSHKDRFVLTTFLNPCSICSIETNDRRTGWVVSDREDDYRGYHVRFLSWQFIHDLWQSLIFY